MIRILEEIRSFTPFGIRFWDAVLDTQVRDGLAVEAWPRLRPQKSRAAYRTLSDVYAFRDLPGLRALESRLPEAEASPPTPQRFIVQARDRRDRFLTVAFAVDLPLDYMGPFLAGSEVSPLEPSSDGFVLLSAPNRPNVGWLATVRGELADVSTGEPASHALLRLRSPGESSWYGLADEGGRFALFLPYPALLDGLGGSPGNGNSAPLEERTWPLTIEVFWEPGSQQPLPGARVPDYLSLLHQAQGGVWPVRPQDGGVEQPLWSGDLEYGTQLDLATQGRSQLLVSPASSP